MNAAVVEAFTRPPRYASFADPVPTDTEELVEVTAAALHPIVKALANGSHYGSSANFPFVPGVDGVGKLQDGSRVYFGVTRSGYGTFAERAVTESWMRLRLPDAADDVTVAAMMNPGMSSWAALKARAQYVTGENILILGATGIAGQLAVQIAKLLGAQKVIAAGRNPEALAKLAALGADAVISLEQGHDNLVSAFRTEYVDGGGDIVLDYLWGRPAEAVLEAISQRGLDRAASRIRFIQIGSSAGKDISLPAATLRSSGLELLGSGFGSASFDQIRIAIAEFFEAGAKAPFHFNTHAVPLREVEALWNQAEQGTRLVFQT